MRDCPLAGTAVVLLALAGCTSGSAPAPSSSRTGSAEATATSTARRIEGTVSVHATGFGADIRLEGRRAARPPGPPNFPTRSHFRTTGSETNHCSITSARLYATALGLYEMRINGARVGDHVLDPAFTDYMRRVLYSTYDVTDLVRSGENVVGVMLGINAVSAAQAALLSPSTGSIPEGAGLKPPWPSPR